MKTILAGLALAFLTVAGPVGAACQLATLASMPVTMAGLRPTIHAQLNGKDVKLLVDTGAFFSLLTPGKTLELGLETRPAPPGYYITGIGGMSIPHVATVNNVVLDTIPIRKADFLITGNEIDHDVAGVLGRNT